MGFGDRGVVLPLASLPIRVPRSIQAGDIFWNLLLARGTPNSTHDGALYPQPTGHGKRHRQNCCDNAEPKQPPLMAAEDGKQLLNREGIDVYAV